jgi:hypothetical protein
MHRVIFIVTCVALAAACASDLSRARTSGSGDPLDALAGHWAGTYTTDQGTSAGTLAFDLDAAGDGARGPVTLKAEGAPEPYRPLNLDTPQRDGTDQPADDHPLMLRWLAASDGMVYGDIDLYRDPARDTGVLMTLRGAYADDALSGTFRTTYTDGSPQATGRWSVRRDAGAE